MTAAALAAAALLVAQASPPAGDPPPVVVVSQVEGPADPPATTEWHREPVLEKKVGKNVVVYNHADATLETATIVDLLQKQYDWLAEYVGVAPRWVLVHVGAKYPLGFMIRSGPDPEMFLQAGSIFDTSANYAHEMMHCFMSELGGSIPHWFNESVSDLAWMDSEIELWKRRREEPWLATFDRVDYRSLELVTLRRAFGRTYFRKVFAALVKRKDDCRATFSDAAKLDTKNELLVGALSEAAGEDVLPRLKELGFNPRTRERQRGY
jgi:hypothetical protein